MGKSWKKRRLINLRNHKVSIVEKLETMEDSKESEKFPEFDISMKKTELVEICEKANLTLNFEELTKKQIIKFLEDFKSEKFSNKKKNTD